MWCTSCTGAVSMVLLASDLVDVNAAFVADQVHHPAVRAHLEAIERALRGKHRMAGKLPEHRGDHLFGAQRLAAGDAVEDCGRVEDTRGAGPGREVEARGE